MPEGDTIHTAARRVGAALVGREILALETPQARHRHCAGWPLRSPSQQRWPERLSGRGVRAVDALGKHLFVRFEGDLTLHSHLRMRGLWGVYRHGQRWRRSQRRAWLVIRTAEHEVVQFDGPVLELMTDSRTRFDRRIAELGPDVLGTDFDEARFLGRLREDDPTRGFGDALLDQRTVAGIGNIWKAESCFHAGVSPWRPTGEVTDQEALAVVCEARARMRASVDGPGYLPKPAVYERAGLPCPRCGTLVNSRGQGDDNRITYWCPGCQS